MKRKKKKLREIAKKLGVSLNVVIKAHSMLKRPLKFSLSAIADKLEEMGTYRKQYGAVKNTFQTLNPLTGRWVKFRRNPDTGQVRIVGQKKTRGPWKNVRKK